MVSYGANDEEGAHDGDASVGWPYRSLIAGIPPGDAEEHSVAFVLDARMVCGQEGIASHIVASLQGAVGELRDALASCALQGAEGSSG